MEQDGRKVKVAEIGLNERRTAARDIHEILKTKMRFIGVDGEIDNVDAGDPVDLNKYKPEERKRGAENG